MAGDIWRQGPTPLHKATRVTKDSTGICTQRPCCNCYGSSPPTAGSGQEKTYPWQTFLQGTPAACPSGTQHLPIPSTLAVLEVLRASTPVCMATNGSSQLVSQSTASLRPWGPGLC